MTTAKKGDEIAAWFKEHQSPEMDDLLRRFMEEGVNSIDTEVQQIHRQIKR